ncbi:TonB-dependent receptor [Prosthecochloris sp. ZM_2]|uniref:TonB-dependent receptor n=1 Tax=Prosthecochloris sp. ZM_2 TaxID=2045206 RepID=UPI000DF7A098|nr:TonB-dependent receptor [Prosthecochloris sp. ZM_2]RNA65313.1 TonB-dependent receptor [Prosthecochloris sp. ZM_2]
MCKYRRCLPAALALLAAIGFSGFQELNAQEIPADTEASATVPLKEFQFETIVVTADAIDDEQQEIESRELRTHKVVDLAEILSDELVEVQMIRKSGYGNEVSVRGFGQENIKVLLDGGTLEGACGSRKDPSLSHINMLTVQKLTLQEGPFDVTKPGCLGGYIDVVTRKPEEGFHGEVLGKVGSYGFQSGGFTTTGGSDKVQWLFGYNYSESGQYEDGDGNRLWSVREGQAASYSDEGRDAKSFQKHDVWGKLQFTPNENSTILLEHSYGKANDILTPRVVFDTEEELTNLTKASWEIRNLGKLSETLTLSVYRNEVDHSPFQEYRNVAVPKNNEVESVISGGAIQNVTETDFATLTYGIDWYHRDWWGDVYNSVTGQKLNDVLIPSVRSLNLGGYVKMDKTFDRLSLGLGLRYDRFRQEADEELKFTSAVTDVNRNVDHLVGGHLSFRYVLNDEAMLFGGVGRSYRTPTSSERYIQGNPKFFGNPDLKPTANTEFDMGFLYEFKGVKVQAKGFYSSLDDYIYQENSVAGYKSYTNIDAHIWGGDVKASVDLSDVFSLEGGIAYQKGVKESFPDNNSDDDLGQMAPLKGMLALNYKSDTTLGRQGSGLFGTVEWVHSNASKNVDADAGEKPLDAWDIINLRMGYRYKSYRFNVGMDNVFDQQYTVANSYEWDVIGGTGASPAIVSEPGRFIYATLGYAW